MLLPVLTLRALPEASVPVGGQVQLVARLTDVDGLPMPGERIQFTYDSMWNLSHYVSTDAQGVATYTLSLANNLNAPGFVGSGGSRNNATMYTAHAMYQGERTDAVFMVSSGTAIQTKAVVESAPGTIVRGQVASITGRLTDSTGKPLANGRNVTVRGFYDSKNGQTDGTGRFTVQLVTTGAALGAQTVSLIYSGDSAATGGLANGCAANVQVVVTGAEVVRAKPAPLPYIMYDWANTDPAEHPKYGAFGSFHIVAWNLAGEDQDFAPLRSYLDVADAQNHKPVILCIYFYGSGTTFVDYTPNDVKARTGGSYVLAPTGCTSQVAPRYNNSTWQAAFKGMIDKLAVAFDNDPRVSGIVIATGLDGETVATKNQGSCDYQTELRKVCSDNQYQVFVKVAMGWYADAFKHQPLYIQGFPKFDGGLDFGMTLANPIGLKDQNWWQDTGGFAYKSNGEWTGSAEVYLNRPDMPRAYESAWGRFFMGGAQGTFAMLTSMLSHGSPDFVDLHSDHFDTFAEYPWLSPWFIQYLGVDVKSSPGAWVLMRDIQASATKELGGNLSEQYGDYSLFMYRLEDEPGAHTVPVPYTTLPTQAQAQIWTNTNQRDRLGNPSPAMTARRTDQANGNTLMLMDCEDGWGFGSGLWTVKLLYLDVGTGAFSMQWCDTAGNIINHWITRTNTGLWQEETFTVTNLANGFGNADLRLWTGGNGDVTIRMVEVLR